MAGRSTPFATVPFRWPEITWSLAACREISPCHSHVMQVAPQAHLPHVHKFSSAPPLPPPLPSLLFPLSSPSLCACVNCCCTMTAPTPLLSLSLLWRCLAAQEQPRLLLLLLLFPMLSLAVLGLLPGRPFAWIWGHM